MAGEGGFESDADTDQHGKGGEGGGRGVSRGIGRTATCGVR